MKRAQPKNLQSYTGVTKVIWRQERVQRRTAWIAVRSSDRTVWLPDLKKTY